VFVKIVVRVMDTAHKGCKVRVEVIISSSDSSFLDSLYAAFLPESGATPRYRAEISIARAPEAFLVNLLSEDISSLRASLNTILRALGAIFSVSERYLPAQQAAAQAEENRVPHRAAQ